MKRPAVLAMLVLAGCGGAAAPKPPGEVKVDRVKLTPGTMGIVVSNGTDAPARLAQVAVDDGFVAFAGPERTVAPHATATLAIPYPWIAGQAYRVKVLTGEGAALEYQLDAS